MKISHLLANAAMITLASSAVCKAETTTVIGPAQQKQIESIVHNYIVKNPTVIIEAVQALQQKQVEDNQKAMQKTQAVAAKFSDALFRQANDPIAGNANGKIILVDFFDYQCVHCTKMPPVIEALVKSNPNVKVVFKEFPIRGSLSEYASKMALAAKNQNKYIEFHKALMHRATEPTPLTEDAVLKVAESLGLNIPQLKLDMKADSIKQQLKTNVKLAQDLQLIGTPALFIAVSDGSNKIAPEAIRFLPGMVDEQQLQAVIKKLDGK